MIRSRLLPIAASVLLAGLASTGLHWLAGSGRSLRLPATEVVLALSLALAVTVFGSVLGGAVLLVPAGLSYAGQPVTLLAGVLIAAYAVGQVALWRRWIPFTMPPPPS